MVFTYFQSAIFLIIRSLLLLFISSFIFADLILKWLKLRNYLLTHPRLLFLLQFASWVKISWNLKQNQIFTVYKLFFPNHSKALFSFDRNEFFSIAFFFRSKTRIWTSRKIHQDYYHIKKSNTHHCSEYGWMAQIELVKFPNFIAICSF